MAQRLFRPNGSYETMRKEKLYEKLILKLFLSFDLHKRVKKIKKEEKEIGNVRCV